jgi:hypothetical protein
MRTLIALTLFAFSIASYAEEWTPEIKFSLEQADFKQTLSWVSGVSYSLTNYQASTSTPLFCNAPNSIGSKILLGYLNTSHSGQKISAEQAIDTIFKSLKKDYPCK